MSRALKQRPTEDQDWRPDQRDIDLIVAGRHDDPFAVLGPHRGGDDVSVRVFHPAAASVEVIDSAGNVLAALERLHDAGFFAGPVGIDDVSTAYRLRFLRDGAQWETDDPYRFPPLLADLDVHLITEGTHRRLYERLGAHPISLDQLMASPLRCGPPTRRRVSVVGEFNDWDGRRHPMRKRHGAGVWELFIPGLRRDALYKFEILGAHGEVLPLKADPFAFAQEAPPSTASRIHGLIEHDWGDAGWIERTGRSPRIVPRRSQSMRSISARGGAASTTASWITTASPIFLFLMSATSASPMSSCCRSANTRFPGPGVISLSDCSARPRGSVRPRRSRVSSIASIRTASASSSTGSPLIFPATRTASFASTAPRFTSTRIRAADSTRIGTL